MDTQTAKEVNPCRSTVAVRGFFVPGRQRASLARELFRPRLDRWTGRGGRISGPENAFRGYWPDLSR
jgi:hypothetical protein